MAASWPLRIARVHQEIARVFTLEFETPEGFVFQPGQFNMLYAHGAGEVPISIAGDAAEPERLVHTICAVGNVTGVMERLRKGDTVGLRGPYGTAWPMDEARGCDLLFIAGVSGSRRCVRPFCTRSVTATRTAASRCCTARVRPTTCCTGPSWSAGAGASICASRPPSTARAVTGAGLWAW